MKYVVHLYPVFRVAVPVEASSHKEAVKKAIDAVDGVALECLASNQATSLPDGITSFSFAEQINAALVDEDNDPEFEKTRSYRLVKPRDDEPFMDLEDA